MIHFNSKARFFHLRINYRKLSEENIVQLYPKIYWIIHFWKHRKNDIWKEYGFRFLGLEIALIQYRPGCSEI